ncbi:deoxynucleoside kinase [Tepidibacter formicigenes]|jgi:deoxyadenosine/deoxycytidine kinase|uniref:Deoxyadenosine/deoxycytidine kinase n=1 Tax=Tepidibacter formicigenes DSM 15518 TaxID=1123349 RepID=A0A1M6PTQ6_9FIRM|nr:deoxynucleoside kinase [Tepidibacter formicigenes]SHK11295.1 deoxyadenosine/deoxycytidine kinase [Tepidibacter formicigenes DSM 15518]
MLKLVNTFKYNEKSENENIFITVAGNVGAGKSTITKLLGQKLNFKAHFEKVDTNPYLNDFYTDQEKWGFHLQLYFLAQRFKQQKEIAQNGFNNIQDRSIYEDVEIFAKSLYDNKKMSERDFDTYRELFYDMIPHLKKPDLMIYLSGSIETILNRINLRGRDMEKRVPREYWENLHNRYENWIKTYKDSPILYVNIDKVDLIENPHQLDIIAQEIKNILNIKNP